MPYVQDSLALDPALLRYLAEACGELAKASTVERIAEVIGIYAQQHFQADGVTLDFPALQYIEHWPERHEGDAFLASISVLAQSAGALESVSVHWRQARVAAQHEHAILDVLTRAAVLAVKAVTSEDKGQPPTGQYVARERARFFEFQRQVRSLLAVVRSIVRRTVDFPQSKEEYAAHLEGRLDALARVQGFMLRAPEAKVDLEELVRAEFLAQAIGDECMRIAGPRILLSGKAAETLGLVFHELTTNAIKFGSLSHPQGTVLVTWDRQPKDRSVVHLQWREHSQAVVRPATIDRGFGFELIEKVLPYELDAKSTLTIGPGGAHCAITFTAGLDGSRARGESLPT